jgi:hypothetical protein
VKHYLVLVLFALTLILMAVSSASMGTIRTEMRDAPAPTPTPVAVAGSELRRNVATVKPGYTFVKRAHSVDVVKTRNGIRTGTYVCPCNSNDPARLCDIVFAPTEITCKSGSCSGNASSCLLTAKPLVMRQ